MRTENTSSDQINVCRMLLGCLIVFCFVTAILLIVEKDHFLHLFGFFSFLTISCTFLPIPTHSVVMDMGAKYGPAYIAILGVIAFCISAMVDYSIVTIAFQNKRIAKIKATRTYGYVKRVFGKFSFSFIVFGAFTPFPFDPIKLVACTSRYNRFKFILACFIGRVPRYYILGKIQEWGKFPQIYLYGSVLILIAIEIIRNLIGRLLNRRKQKKCNLPGSNQNMINKNNKQIQVKINEIDAFRQGG